MKYLILDPARLTHLIKDEDQLVCIKTFKELLEKIPYTKNSHQLTFEDKKFRDQVLTEFLATALGKPVHIGVLDFEPRDEQLRLKVLQKLDSLKLTLDNITTVWSTALFGCICAVPEDEEIAELIKKHHLDHSIIEFPDRNKLEYLHQDNKTILRVFDLDHDRARDLELEMSLVKLKEKLSGQTPANSAVYGDC